MKRFNYEQFLNIYKKKAKISLILFISLCLIIVGLFVLGILIANYYNKTLIMIIFSLILALLTLPAISILIFGVNKYNNERKQIYYILGSYLSFYEGKIIAINSIITTLCGRKGIEIILETKNGTNAIYYDPIFGDIPFKINDYIRIKCSESFIIQYEVKNG